MIITIKNYRLLDVFSILVDGEFISYFPIDIKQEQLDLLNKLSEIVDFEITEEYVKSDEDLEYEQGVFNFDK